MSLAEACVMETLRLDQAESINRKTTAPFTFEGYRIPEGSGLAILMRETHRDPANFTDPEKFCPHRFLKSTYSADQYAPFGIDEHQCIGRFLAVRLGTMFIEELVRGYRWTVASDGPRQYGAFHWQPAACFAIDLRRTAPGGA
jgi:cytochrome P450